MLGKVPESLGLEVLLEIILSHPLVELGWLLLVGHSLSRRVLNISQGGDFTALCKTHSSV